MQNFELDLSRWVPRSYEACLGGKNANMCVLLTGRVQLLIENWIWPGLIRIRGGKGRSSGAIERENGPN